jgi:hypothetical protein
VRAADRIEERTDGARPTGRRDDDPSGLGVAQPVEADLVRRPGGPPDLCTAQGE